MAEHHFPHPNHVDAFDDDSEIQAPHQHSQADSSSHSSEMHEMMSLAFFNFPVAFFDITKVWQFALIAVVCVAISFAVEFCRSRNVSWNVLFKSRTSSQSPILKRYTPIAVGKLEAGIRQPSFNDIGKPVAASSFKKSIKKRKLKTPDKKQNEHDKATEQLLSQGGILQRILQFFGHFLSTFLHYALMMAAMANLWLMLFICLGGACGYILGICLNDYYQVRHFKCPSCRSAEASHSTAATTMTTRSQKTESVASLSSSDENEQILVNRNSAQFGSLNEMAAAPEVYTNPFDSS